MKYKTRKQMADELGVGTGDTWKLNKTTMPFIDSQVRPVVKKLNERGVSTYSSCQGHAGRSNRGYIAYDTDKKIDSIFRKEGFSIRREKVRYGRNEKKVSFAKLKKPYNLKKQKKTWKRVYEQI